MRTLISRDFAAAFEQADVLVSPTAPTTAFPIGDKVDDPLAMYLNDLATIPTNLAGIAARRQPGAQASGGGGLGDVLGSILGGAGGGGGSNPLGSILGSVLGGKGGASNPIGEILGGLLGGKR